MNELQDTDISVADRPDAERWPWLFAAFLAYLVVACLMILPVGPAATGKWLVIRVVGPLIGLVWWNKRMLHGGRPVRLDPISVLAVLWLATHVVASYVALNRGYAFEQLSFLVGLLATFFCAKQFGEYHDARDRIAWTLLLIGTTTSVYGIAQHHGYDFFLWGENKDAPVERGISFFAHATFAASVLIMIIPIGIGVMATRKRWGGKLAAAVLVAPMFYHLSFSGARMATLAMLVSTSAVITAILFRAVLRRRGAVRDMLSPRRVVGASLVFLAGISLAGWFVARAWEVKNSDVFAIRQASLALRLYSWESTSRMILDHPWTGIGPGNFEVVAPLYWNDIEQIRAPRFDRWMHEAHNDYLETAAEQGLAGIAVLLALMSYGVVLSLDIASRCSDPTDRRMGLAYFAAIVAIALDANITFSLQAPGSALVFWCVLGLVAGACRSESGSPASGDTRTTLADQVPDSVV